MDETESTPETVEAPAVDEHPRRSSRAATAIAMVLAVSGETPSPEPRARIMYRPAPVPEGHIAVEVPDAPFWFLVALDYTCATCAGSGRLPNTGDGALGPENYCTCIMSAVEECWREVRQDGDEHNAELRAEAADQKLKKRVDEALARVNDLEQQCAAAVGDCEREQQELTARIPELHAMSCEADRNMQILRDRAAEATRGVNTVELAAAVERDEAVKRANEVYAEAQRQATRGRQEIAATLQSDLDRYEADKSKAGRDRVAAEERLAYLKAGPEKIRRRFEQKLQGPRATLERLERQWKR